MQVGKETNSKAEKYNIRMASTFAIHILSNHTQYKHMTYCGNKLIHTVRSHTVEVCEVELKVDLVVEHVLA